MIVPDEDDQRAARGALTFIAEPADPVIGALLARHNSVRMLQMLTTADAANLGGPAMAPAARRTLDRCRERLAGIPRPAQIAAWQHAGIRLACPGDPEWPDQLDDLGPNRPYALWLRGPADLRSACQRSVSITGSRACTAYGAHVASQMASHAAGRGWTVISGAAYGVDAAACTGALAAGGTTVAVLAGGVDIPYPVGHKDLLETIAREGVIASEHPPGRNPSRLRFLHRNRIIAALPAGTLVIEAGARSGTLNTARHARDLHRKLMAVPGPVTSEQSRGCHTIIRDWGGTLISDPADILRELDPPPEARDTRPAPPAPLSLEAAAVLDALPARGGLGTAAVAAKAGLPAADVLRLLGELTADGLAERCEHGWRLRPT